MLKLAVISDIHVGLAAKSKDLCPVPPKNERKNREKYNQKIENSYKQKFFDFIKKSGLSADFLVLPGDLTNNAHPEQFKIVSEFIQESAIQLKTPMDQIVFTPGNHDVDWSQYDSQDSMKIKWHDRYRSLLSEHFLFNKLLSNSNGKLLSTPYYCIWNFENLLVVSYNSSSHDKPTVAKDVHHGLADPDHIEELKGQLQELDSNSNDKYKVFIVHHHLLPFHEPVRTDPDFSIMVNSDGIVDFLHQFKFDFVIHGHKHFPKFDTLSDHKYSPIPILCSGSFSIEIDNRWSGTITNQFHIIEIKNKNSSDNLINGHVKSWSNNYVNGWQPSEKTTTGIHHIIPFGKYLIPEKLDSLIRPYIEQIVLDNKHITWEDIIRMYPELKYLPIDSAIDSFSRIATTLGKQSMYKTQKDLIIY